MIREEFAELGHERVESFLAHVRNRPVPVATLVEERHSPSLHGIRLQNSVEAARFAGRAEKCEQGLREGRYEEQAVSTIGTANVGGREPHPEVVVLDVAERLLDREAPRIAADYLRSSHSARRSLSFDFSTVFQTSGVARPCELTRYRAIVE